MRLTFGSLFAGIGGFDLGFERAGMECRWQVEIDPYCQRVLAKHWRDVKRYGDIRDQHDLEPVDVVCGGFPCQDVSDASRGRGGGIEGERSGLWREFKRIIAAVAPDGVIVENVDGAAWKRWLPIVRRDLHCLRYASLPIRMRASDFGAPFQGSRIFVIAKTYGQGESIGQVNAQMAELCRTARPMRQDWGKPTPRALGVANGVPCRMERLKGSGNAAMPVMAELAGRLMFDALTAPAAKGDGDE